MFKKIVFTISFILISFLAIAQKSINDYKYILVPKSFEFSKAVDQYQLNSLTKFLFNKYGYEAYFMDDVLPEDLRKDRCLALTSEVLNEKKGMFKTKVEFILKDCFGTVVMISKTGESRLKEYNKSYIEALRDAFETFQNLDYKYVPNEAETNVVIKTSVEPKEKMIKISKNKIATKSKEIHHKTEVEEKQQEIKQQPIESNIANLYYAQAINNGYQLVNAEPRIVMILLTTAAENVFIVKDKSAIVFKEDGFWYYSENNGKLGEKKSMNIKF